MSILSENLVNITDEQVSKEVEFNSLVQIVVDGLNKRWEAYTNDPRSSYNKSSYNKKRNSFRSFASTYGSKRYTIVIKYKVLVEGKWVELATSVIESMSGYITDVRSITNRLKSIREVVEKENGEIIKMYVA